MTLIFGLEQYRDVMEAYVAGLEQAHDNGHDLSQDPLGGVVLRLPRRHRDRQAARGDIGADDDPALRGKAGVANARLAFQAFEEFFTGARWEALEAPGARQQRPLWASTGVKNPDYATRCTSSTWSSRTPSTRCPRRPCEAVRRPRRGARATGSGRATTTPPPGDGGARRRPASTTTT